MNYPKVCFGCSRCHILDEKHEMISEDGTKAFHVDCYSKPVVPLEILVTEPKNTNIVPDALQPNKDAITLDDMIKSGFAPDNIMELYQRHLDKLNEKLPVVEPVVELEVNS